MEQCVCYRPALLVGKPRWLSCACFCFCFFARNWLAVLCVMWWRLWPHLDVDRKKRANAALNLLLFCRELWDWGLPWQTDCFFRWAYQPTLLHMAFFCHSYRGCRVKSPEQRLPVPRQRMLAWTWRLKLPFQLKWNRAHSNWHWKGQFHNYIN